MIKVKNPARRDRGAKAEHNMEMAHNEEKNGCKKRRGVNGLLIVARDFVSVKGQGLTL